MSKLRYEVLSFSELCPLPDSQSATPEQLALIEERLSRIERPVTNEEARLLATCFGPDDLYGLAWTLLHVIESSPDWADLGIDSLPSPNTQWASILKTRIEQARRT